MICFEKKGEKEKEILGACKSNSFILALPPLLPCTTTFHFPPSRISSLHHREVEVCLYFSLPLLSPSSLCFSPSLSSPSSLSLTAVECLRYFHSHLSYVSIHVTQLSIVLRSSPPSAIGTFERSETFVKPPPESP